MGDGLPCLLTGDVFYERVVEAEAVQRREAREKQERQEKQGERAEALVEWRRAEEARKEVITSRRVAWEAEKKEWEAEKVLAKAENRKFTTKKPILGKLPATISRPKANLTPEEADTDDDDSRSP